MRTAWWILLAAIMFSGACASLSVAQESVADRIEALETELAELKQRAAAIETEITGLRAILAGAGQTVRNARANDEEHEFISYPVYRFHSGDLHLMLRRIG